MKTIELETPRLFLREFTLKDAPLLISLNTPMVLKYINEPVITSLIDAKNILTEIILPQYSLYGLGRLAIYIKEDYRFIGWCGLKYLNETNEIDLGYRLMENEWGKGYATEAANASLDFGFNNKKLTEIIGRAHIDNFASQNVLQKIGLKFIKNEMVGNDFIKKYNLKKADYFNK